MGRRFRAVCLAAALAGCGSSDARTFSLVRVTPEVTPSCGAPVDGRNLLVTALGDFAPSGAGQALDLSQIGSQTEAERRFRIDSFPADTRVLEVVVIGANGTTRTVGRTAEFDLAELDDGDRVPVFMAPPRGFCPTGSAGSAGRIGALVSRVGAGALVVGGVSTAGEPVPGALYYDPATGRMDSAGDGVYGDPALGLVGASMSQLGDDRVVVVGGAAPAYQVYDAADGRFGLAAFLPGARAHHAAVALDAERVLLAGGCSQLEADGRCRADALLTSTSILDVSTGDVTEGPALASARVGGQAFLEPDGRVVIVGGSDGAGAAVVGGERIDPSGVRAGEAIAGGSGVAARLVDGGLLVGLGSSAEPGAAASVVPAGGTAASAVGSAPRERSGATATLLDDGRVLILGGVSDASGAEALLYEPDTGSFAALAAVPDAGAGGVFRRDHIAVALADGTVLVGFGRDLAGEALGDAWVFRADLTGRYSSDATLSFDVAAAGDLILSPRDPARFRRQPGGGGLPATMVLEASGVGGALADQWAVLAGPAFVEASVTARLRVEAGGAALLLGFVDRGNYATVVLGPGAPAQLYRVVDGQPQVDPACTGEVVSAGALSPAAGLATVTLELRGDVLTVALGDAEVLSCADLDPIARGHIGLGVTGASDAELSIASLTVGR